jgi:hypothetical protein
LRAAREGLSVTKLALWEPNFLVDDSRPPLPDDYVAQLEERIAADRRGDAVEYFLRTAIGLPSEYVAPMRKTPMWAGMEEVAHTLPYDGRVAEGFSLPTDDSGQSARRPWSWRAGKRRGCKAVRRHLRRRCRTANSTCSKVRSTVLHPRRSRPCSSSSSRVDDQRERRARCLRQPQRALAGEVRLRIGNPATREAGRGPSPAQAMQTPGTATLSNTWGAATAASG